MIVEFDGKGLPFNPEGHQKKQLAELVRRDLVKGAIVKPGRYPFNIPETPDERYVLLVSGDGIGELWTQTLGGATRRSWVSREARGEYGELKANIMVPIGAIEEQRIAVISPKTLESMHAFLVGENNFGEKVLWRAYWYVYVFGTNQSEK